MQWIRRASARQSSKPSAWTSWTGYPPDDSEASVAITKRNRVVALLVPPLDEAAAVRQLHGFLRGTVVTPPGIDLTEPVLDEAFSAARGAPHD